MTGVTGGDWLQEQRRRGHLAWHMVEAARLWASDLMEIHCELRSNRPDREFRSQAPADIMRVALSRRLADAERRLGGEASPIYQAVYEVAVVGGTAGEVAAKFEIRTTSAMDLVRLGLASLAVAYGVRERLLTG